jgi:hypothetical protein
LERAEVGEQLGHTSRAVFVDCLQPAVQVSPGLGIACRYPWGWRRPSRPVGRPVPVRQG